MLEDNMEKYIKLFQDAILSLSSYVYNVIWWSSTDIKIISYPYTLIQMVLLCYFHSWEFFSNSSYYKKM